MKWTIAHPHICAHHRYQLEVIFLFIAGFFLIFPYYLFLETYGLSVETWQWLFFIPWLAFYISYCLYERNQIPDTEMRAPLIRPIGHWVIFGLSLVVMHEESQLFHGLGTEALDLAFIVFSLFLADSYLDFHKRNRRVTPATS